MKRHLTYLLALALALSFTACSEKEDPVEVDTDEISYVDYKLICTSDLSGRLYPATCFSSGWLLGGLSRATTYIYTQQSRFKDRTFVFDAGDIFSGTPESYYLTNIAPDGIETMAEMFNWVGYDAVAPGNHEMEAGEQASNRFADALNGEYIAANVISKVTGKPYYKPYIVLEKEGLKVAVLGMTLANNDKRYQTCLLPDVEFADIVETASYWADYIQKNEKPDLLVGLFHVGLNNAGTSPTEEYATRTVAETVPGFDIIFYGHDHKENIEWIEAKNGRKVLVMNPGSNGMNVAECKVQVKVDGKGVIHGIDLYAGMVDVSKKEYPEDWSAKFVPGYQECYNYMSGALCTLEGTLDMLEHYYGPSSMMGFLGDVQRSAINSDIQFLTAPTYSPAIAPGKIVRAYVYNIFSYMVYRYSALRMTGKEVKDYLERSCDLWFNTMTSSSDKMLKVDASGKLQTSYYTTVCAEGIKYEVDLSKPDGKKVTILGMEDGSAFEEGKEYVVSMNSYLAHDDTEHLLTQGAGIPAPEIKGRIVKENPIDHFQASIAYLGGITGTYTAHVPDNWKLLPEDWVAAARARELQ